MALATQCPHCHTTFRVANDQLKLRAGLVRCGACKEIFNGIEHLLGSAEATPAKPAPDNPVATENIPVVSPITAPDPELASKSAALSASLDFMVDEPPPEPTPDADESAQETHALAETPQQSEGAATSEPPSPSPAPDRTDNPLRDQIDDPLQRMTLMEFSDVDDADASTAADAAAAADIEDPLDRVIEDLQRKPLRGSKKKPATPKTVPVPDGESDNLDNPVFAEPDFVTLGKRRQKLGRTLRISMALGSFLLLVGLLAQAAYGFRDQIAARLPQTKPVLARACAVIGCRLELPAQIEALSIESSELQAVPGRPDMFVLTTLLRNDSAIGQAWPNIELTLNDANEQALARRVFTPHDYLPAIQDAAKGFAANSEQAVKLSFEVAQLKAAGYRVGLFYP